MAQVKTATRASKPKEPSAATSAPQTAGDHSGPAAQAPAPVEAARACPTRVGGAQPLFQTKISVSQCQSKQRGLYHKCFTCVHANAR